MVFATTISVYDNGPVHPGSEALAENVGALIAERVDVAIENLPSGWRGTFMRGLPLQLGGLYWIETPAKKRALIDVTAATGSEVSFDGQGDSPF